MAAKDFFSSSAIRLLAQSQQRGDGTAVITQQVDTFGFKWGIISLNLGAVGATANTDITVQVSDAEGGTYEDIPGAVFTVLPTDDDKVRMGVIDLHRFGRYMRLDGSVGAGGSTVMGATMVLYGASNTDTLLDRGDVDAIDFEVLMASTD